MNDPRVDYYAYWALYQDTMSIQDYHDMIVENIEKHEMWEILKNE